MNKIHSQKEASRPQAISPDCVRRSTTSDLHCEEHNAAAVVSVCQENVLLEC
jgi:hypothetical protein